jgi:hypothetical protein
MAGLEFFCSQLLKVEPARALRDEYHVRLGDALQACCEVRRFPDDPALLRLSRSD